jgi:hypothetical protein
MWDVRRCSLSALEARFAADAPASAEAFVPERLVVCRHSVERARVEGLAARIGKVSGRKVAVVWLAPGGYKGVLRNVPQCGEMEGDDCECDATLYCDEVVAVALQPAFAVMRAAGRC